MKRQSTITMLVIAAAFMISSDVLAHCEIPCGIYDDDMRVSMLKEHTATIEKAMQQILTLQKEQPRNDNQIVRWVTNKERHAEELQHIVTQYFMTQRIKPSMKNYEKNLSLLHQMLLAAMKCKQTTDIGNVERLTTLIQDFQALYFQKK